jgi:hypothetical protein
MKNLIAIFMIGIFAFAFTAVHATDTSPGHQKFSIEKTTLQAAAAFVSVNQQITEIPVFSFMVSPQASAEKSFLYSNSLEKENRSEIYHSPGLFVRKNFKSPEINYQSKIFSPARIIPYSRDRS